MFGERGSGASRHRSDSRLGIENFGRYPDLGQELSLGVPHKHFQDLSSRRENCIPPQ